MQADLEKAVSLLGILYRQLELGWGPEFQPPEIAAIVEIANQISRPGAPPQRGGQGFGLTADERKLVEIRAIMVTRIWLNEYGFLQVKDSIAKASFDYTISTLCFAALPKRARGQRLPTSARCSESSTGAYGLTPEDIALMWRTAPPRMPASKCCQRMRLRTCSRKFSQK